MKERPGSDGYSLGQLADESGVAPRTIRYYIARGLMEGPLVAGRGAQYTQEHLDRLREIRRLQQQGRMLADIALETSDGGTAEALPAGEQWERYAVAPDVEVLVRAGGAPWRMKRVRQALRDLASRLAEPEGKEELE